MARGAFTAVDCPTCFVTAKGRRIAYRRLGEGSALILCARFRGTMESWDPLFLDELAQRLHIVIFDYSGTGQSNGPPSFDPKALARDAIDLADALGLSAFAIGGWSLGGSAAQVLAAVWPRRTTHLVLLGATPPGNVPHAPETIFFERALKPEQDLIDETMLYFEPTSPASRKAATSYFTRMTLRSDSLSPAMPEELYLRLLKEAAHEDLFHDDGGYRDFLETTVTPILVITADHDIAFPAGNWMALVGKWRTLRLMIYPQAGHGVHQQYPESCASVIANFVGHDV